MEDTTKSLKIAELEKIVDKINQACALTDVAALLKGATLNESTRYFYFTTLKELLESVKSRVIDIDGGRMH